MSEFLHQIAPVVWGILTLLDPADDSCSFLHIWIYVFALLSITHILGAFYIAYRMAEDIEESQEPNMEERGSHGAAGQRQSPGREQGKYIWEYINDLFTTNRNGNQSTQQQQQREPSSGSSRGGSNSWKRLSHLMCYDPGVALYMVIFVAWIVWLPIGISTLVSVDEDEDSCDRVAIYAQGSVICGFVYGFLVTVCFCCSFIFLKL